MTYRPPILKTPGAFWVLLTCHGRTDWPAGMLGNADDPYEFPVMVPKPEFGEPERRTPMWFPHVVPVVYA
jgi:hypothetical protein